MKERPIFPLLVSMALPMVLSMTVNALYNIVDSFFVAQISEQAMTALSLVYPVQNMINAIAIGFGVGINALIALYSGAGDRCRADTAATHGLVFSILHGLIAAVVCIAMMPGFLRLFTGDEAVIALGVRYSSIAFFFAPVIMAELCFEKLFQAVGRMNETMAALLCGSITNIILDPVLIFGLGPFPMLGISGAALATGIGQWRHLKRLPYYLLHPPFSRAAAAELHQAGLAAGCQALLHRRSRHSQPGAALGVGFFPQLSASRLLAGVCGHSGYLL